MSEVKETQKKDTSPRGLYQKLMVIQRGVRSLGKDASGYGYQYVSGSKLLSFIRPLMDDLGLMLIPDTIKVEQQLIETKPKKFEMYIMLHKTYTWLDVDSGEKLTCNFFSQGCNGYDKALGSAETYAERYFIMKFFHIATDEDDTDAQEKEKVDWINKLESVKSREEFVVVYKNAIANGVSKDDEVFKKVAMQVAQKFPKQQEVNDEN